MRVGRTAFGVVLVGVGASVLVNGLATHDSHAAAWLAWGWLAAIAAGLFGTAVGLAWRSPRRLGPSLVWPSLGLALALPLTVHALIWCSIGWGTSDFDEWVFIVARFGLPAHLLAAVLLGWRAHQIGTGAKRWPVGACYGAVCGAGIFPIFVGILIVAITGLPFLLVCWYTERLGNQEFERVQISSATALPAKAS